MDSQNYMRDHWRQIYHLMPEKGWLNVANGAAYFNGRYHIYHQYVPENPNGGATHWGHKSSDDLVHFKEEDIFLSPDKVFDKDGVYSGGAFEKDGQLHFFYTGNVKQVGDYDYLYAGREQNVVHVVSSDGYDVIKREVVISHEDFPKDFTAHIRDPKLFEHENRYYMILGGRLKANRGAILLYVSDNLENWDYSGNLLKGTEDQGYMWECPDIFWLEGKAILVFSPQGIRPKDHQFLNPHVVCYMVGEIDWETLKFIPKTDLIELDQGFDFYASHSFYDGNDQILWAWMGIGDTSPEYIYPTVSRGWQHCLIMPRKLELVGDRLVQKPLDNYRTLRSDEESYENIQSLESGRLAGQRYELSLNFSESPKEFSLTLRQDTQLTYEDGLLTLEMGPSGYGRRKRYVKTEKLDALRIFSDNSSHEIFINEGEAVISSRVFPEVDADLITFNSKAPVDLHFWPNMKQ